MTLEFELSSPTPSNNQLLRMHWANKRKARIALSWEVKDLTAHMEWFPTGPEFAKVTIVRVGRKLLDRDNLYGGAKLLIDALKLCWLIRDDDPAHIDLTVEQEIGTPPRTRVRLEAE